MVQVGSILFVTDKSGTALCECIKVLGSGKKRIAYLSDVILVSIKRLNLLRYSRLKERQKKKFNVGTLHRGLVIRTKVYYCRFPGIFVRFDENSVVLVNKKVVPVSNRVYGPVLMELCIRHPSVGCVSRYII